MNFKNRKTPHLVYCLIKNKKPIYVGCCIDEKRREKAHRKLKDFDYLLIIKRYLNKQDALIAENGIIRFLSILQDDNIVNGLFINLISEKEIMDYRYEARS